MHTDFPQSLHIASCVCRVWSEVMQSSPRISNADAHQSQTVDPVIIVHGGAWHIPDERTVASLSGVQQAALTAHILLGQDGSALQAVETAIKSLESNPNFDAGVGSCLTDTGVVEMDAAIMSDEPELGAVSCLSNVKHPIEVARAVLHSEHCFLTGAGADRFAKQEGFDSVDQSDLVTDAALKEWQHFNKYGAVVRDLFNSGHDTVGAVALDKNGRIACGTSTGGITFKRQGRVGDSPVVGCGLYCERGVGGVSATGHGESLLKVPVCKHIIDLISLTNVSVDVAAKEALRVMKSRTHGCGGVVALGPDGKWSAECTTTRMAWACVDANGSGYSGIENGQVEAFDVPKETFIAKSSNEGGTNGGET